MRPLLVLPRALAVSALLSLAVLTASAQAAPQMTALGVGPSANVLYRFDAATPSATSAIPVVGLGVSTLVGIDYRPANGKLYGLGVNGNAASLFMIDPASGVATPVGGATIISITGAAAWGVAFNPVSDRLRVVNNLASGAGTNVNNFRLHPDTGAIAGVDTDLDFTGLPGGAANAPEVALAHDPSATGATATTLFGLTSGGDRTVRQGGVNGTPSPNGGILSNVGLLGVDISNNSGLDIDPVTGEAYAVLQVAGASGLYRINLATGAATNVGLVGTGMSTLGSIAVDPPPAGPPPPTPEPMLEVLRLRPSAFRTANIGGAILSKARKAPVGTTVSYTVSVAATIAFAVERKSIGRRVGKACRKLTPGNRDRKPCPRFKPLKVGFSHAGAAGGNSFKFTGRLAGRALKPGRYRLVARAGASSRRASFTIVPSAR